LGLVVSLALALWSATTGTQAMMAALNIAYEEPERRERTALAIPRALRAVYIALLYRYGPCRRSAKWHWVSVGLSSPWWYG
jgi:uncharacterized BrkB/YihY/UPF0761 family membrane protein